MKHQHIKTSHKDNKFHRIVVNPNIIESIPGLLKAHDCAANPTLRVLSQTAPEGYSIVRSGTHEIGLRDMVFLGGMRPYWQSARRAGEVGSMCRYSSAMSVAKIAA